MAVMPSRERMRELSVIQYQPRIILLGRVDAQKPLRQLAFHGAEQHRPPAFGRNGLREVHHG
jgi:hypothetical protein